MSHRTVITVNDHFFTVTARIPKKGLLSVTLQSRPDLFEGVRSAGLGLGVLNAMARVLSGLLHGLLSDVRASDPLVLARPASLIAATALAACFFPARRAVRVYSTTALRCDYPIADRANP